MGLDHVILWAQHSTRYRGHSNATMMSAADDSECNNKRRKTTTSPRFPRITDVPDEALAAVAEFLAAPSRALFALAMTTQRGSSREWKRTTATSRAILGDGARWTTLDFGDVEDDGLAGRLSDDNVSGLLTCIDSFDRLRTLKLTGCVGITGSGLEPLRGSTSLVQIDLSPDRRRREGGPSLSEGCVLPILESVIDAPGNSLKHVQLPWKFRRGRSSDFDDFIEKYDEFLENGTPGGSCARCLVGAWGGMDGGGSPWVVDCRDDPHYGLQNYTCYGCTEHFCTENDCLVRCGECDKSYCTDCVEIVECASCKGKMCAQCWEMKGGNRRCGERVCDTCVDRGGCCDGISRALESFTQPYQGTLQLTD